VGDSFEVNPGEARGLGVLKNLKVLQPGERSDHRGVMSASHRSEAGISRRRRLDLQTGELSDDRVEGSIKA
jgi:hypothetical protein